MGAVAGPPPGFIPLETSDETSPDQVGDARDHIIANIPWAKAHGVPTLTWADFQVRDRPLIIVGGGPSLRDTEGELREWAERGDVIAINDAHDWLIERGIVPKMFAMQEIAEWPNEFIRHANDTTEYYLASMAHPTAFERLLGRKLTMFHSYAGIGEDQITRDHDPGHPIVCGGEAMAIRAINFGWVKGYTDFHMFGVDGCYAEGDTHVYLHRPRPPMPIYAAGRKFNSAYYLARQAKDLARFIKNCGHMFTLTTHGDGLVQHVHRTIAPDRYPTRRLRRDHFGMIDSHAHGKD